MGTVIQLSRCTVGSTRRQYQCRNAGKWRYAISLYRLIPRFYNGSIDYSDIEFPLTITERKEGQRISPLSNTERKYFLGFGKDGGQIHIIVHPIECKPVEGVS